VLFRDGVERRVERFIGHREGWEESVASGNGSECFSSEEEECEVAELVRQ
jgi:hypothetical protein